MRAIEIKNLTKRYGDITAVKSIEFDVKEGELFGLLGVNGAGKTTTIRMLSGLTRKTSGEIIIFGDSMEKNRNGVKEQINISPQETAIASNLTVRENLQFMAEIYGRNKRIAKERTQEIIERFDLSDVANRKAKTLSGGWQRRLSIAMALITQPKILFLDEPTLGLDVLARRELWEIITQLKGTVTIILTTHYMEEAKELSDRIAIMSKGEIKALGTVEELESQTGTNSLEEAFITIAKGGSHHEI